METKKYIITGLVLGVLVIASGQIGKIYYDNVAKTITDECDAASKAESLAKEVKTKEAKEKGERPPIDYSPLLLCNDREDVIKAKSASRDWQDITIFIGGVVFVFFSLPWAWGFLLKRIRELSNAITGK